MLGKTQIFVCAAVFGVGVGVLIGRIDTRRTTGTSEPDQRRQDRLEQEVAQLRSELRSLRSEPATAPAAPRPALLDTAADRPQGSVDVGRRTLDFWMQMNAVIRQEARMRTVPLGGLLADNAASYLNSRLRAYEFAASGFAELDAEQVDSAAIEVAGRVRQWYLQGINVTRNALSLLDADAGARRGLPGLSWQSDEKAHNAAVRQVNDFAEQTRRALMQKYSLEFPVLE